MSESKNESGRGFLIPAPLFYSMFPALVAAGAGGYGAVSPYIQSQAIEECASYSRELTQVANKNNQAIIYLREENAELRKIINDRTRYRYTLEDAERARIKQMSVDEMQNKRLDNAERQMARHQDPRKHVPSR